MFLNAHDLQPGAQIEADLAIVGGGACGITLARRLSRPGHDVVLLEGGGRQYDEASQELYRGSAEGTCLGPENEYLSSTRLRYFGGTTNHWAGWCRPMDPMDMERRDWLAHSGWPIGYDEMARHFAGAEEMLELLPFARSKGTDYGRWSLFEASDLLIKEIFHLSPPVRFRLKYQDELARARVVLNATVTRIRLDPDGRRVASLEVAAAPGRPFTVRARFVVLAAGGVENPRLLLVSDDVQPDGIGNANDFVGRYFMDHPHRRLGQVLLRHPPDRLMQYRSRPNGGQKRFPVIGLRESYRRQHGLLGATVQIVRKQRVDDGDPVARTLSALDELRNPDWSNEQPPLVALLNIRSEQAPNPESRVTLADELDPNGVRRAKLDWRLGEQDLRTIRETGRLVAAELARTGVGRVQSHIDPDDPWIGTVGGEHHVGTTRMAANASTGVVDSDCRVFGVDNLYIAGSSVYPTAGFVNPTFTLVTLTLRLAEHLERKLESG